jgi:hypothetical protein
MIAPEEFMSWLGRPVRLLPILALFVLAASCGNFFPSESSIQSVVVAPTAILLEAGATPADTYQLAATVTTVGDTTVTTGTTWASYPTSVATVDTTTGLVTAATGAGGNATATITATNGEQSGTAAVLTYAAPAPTSITIYTNPADLSPSVSPNQTFQLVVSPGSSTTINWASYVSWASSNTTYATVSAAGLVTVSSSAPAGATFTITATANFGTAAATGTLTATSTTFTVA